MIDAKVNIEITQATANVFCGFADVSRMAAENPKTMKSIRCQDSVLNFERVETLPAIRIPIAIESQLITITNASMIEGFDTKSRKISSVKSASPK